jgi:hypothetical protein
MHRLLWVFSKFGIYEIFELKSDYFFGLIPLVLSPWIVSIPVGCSSRYAM